MHWHEKMGASLLIRVAGLALLGLAWLAVHALRQRAISLPIGKDALSYALAAFAFLAGSSGASLTWLGPHIFDRVEVSRRWSRRSDD